MRENVNFPQSNVTDANKNTFPWLNFLQYKSITSVAYQIRLLTTIFFFVTAIKSLPLCNYRNVYIFASLQILFLGSIVNCVNEVMTCKRMLQLRVHPLNPAELINVLATMTPIYKEEEEAFDLWWSKTPLVRRRLKAVEIKLEEERAALEKEMEQKKK